jgi:2-polyprenyl-3-methyl-5-hydroxy-6-metoxy-1,4-benzoquinol methylase
MPSPTTQCLVCAGPLELALDLGCDVAVTSDCRAIEGRVQVFRCERCGTLQKVPSAAFRAKVDEIYRAYRSYELSEGHEQVKFLGGVPRARSDILLDNVAGYLPDGGDFLDVGTGAGVFLKAVHKRFGARANLYAHDVTAAAHAALSAALPIRGFFAGDLADVDRRFDVVSMVHVLEHVPSPLEVLRQVGRLLKDDGVLLVQVPNLEETAFDTVIFDHVFHFSPATALGLLHRVFPRCALPERRIHNETTIVAGQDAARIDAVVSALPPARPVDLARVSRAVRLLSAVEEPMAVFGVAPTGTFCGALLGPRLACFVDEDVKIQHKTHLGKPILPPEEVAPGIPVFLPNNRNAELIRARLTGLRFVTESD